MEISYSNCDIGLFFSDIHCLAENIVDTLLLTLLRIVDHILGKVSLCCNSIFGVIFKSEVVEHHQRVYKFFLTNWIVLVFANLLSHDLHTIEQHVLTRCWRTKRDCLSPAGSSLVYVSLFHILCVEREIFYTLCTICSIFALSKKH